jgi:hypothetical protein
MRRFNFLHILVVLVLGCHSQVVGALDFMPYPTAKITYDQWQTFHRKTRDSLGHTQRTYRERNMVVFVDNFNGHHYAFTLPGHAAHPSWIVRRIINVDGEIQVQQVGYYVNEEASFAELFDSYLKLNEQIKPKLQDRNVGSEE